MAHGAHEERDRPAESSYEPAANDAGEHDGSEGELVVQRFGEELHTGTRERGAGAVRVRKSVHTDYEELRVPRRREVVEIERVPADRQEVPEGTELGEDEMIMQVYEEEIVVSKRVVLKEEIRLRKGVVEEEEVIEEDVRREEVDIDDQTAHHR